MNKVEFSRTVVNKKIEQEIEEGVIPDSKVATVNTESYESSMSTKPVAILVKSPPSKNKPADFAGATGHFLIKAGINKARINRNEEGELTLSISGSGNFTQLTAPVIQWPDSMEGFEPKITDTLDHSHSPLNGKRSFRFPFISSRPGNYTIPTISFSFFDPDSNHYRTVTTAPLNIVVNNEEDKPGQQQAVNKAVSVRSHMPVILLVILAAIAIAGIVVLRSKKRKPEPEFTTTTAQPGIDEILAPAYSVSKEDARLFYATLRGCTWRFLAERFGLIGSAMNRQSLMNAMSQEKINQKNQAILLDLLQQCETGMFADVNIEADRNELLEKAKAGMKGVQPG